MDPESLDQPPKAPTQEAPATEAQTQEAPKREQKMPSNLDTQTPINTQSSPIQSILAFFSKIGTYAKNRPYIILIAVMIPIIVFLGGKYYLLSHPDSELTKNLPGLYLDDVLLVVSANLDSETDPKSLTVRFNNPIDTHEIEHFASLSPNIEGAWKTSPLKRTEAVFKFKKPYKGANLWFYIAEGMKSTNNKTLTASFSKRLSITDYSQYEPYSRVKNFAFGKPVPLYSDTSQISIYKSSPEKLLQFLTYSVENKAYRISRYDGAFKEKASEYNDADKIVNLRINQDENTLSLDPGVYYIEGDTSKPYFIVVSSFGALLRQDDKKVYLNPFDVQKGTHIKNEVNFKLYNLQDSVNLLNEFTYSQNKDNIQFEYPTKLDAIIGTYNGEFVFIPVEILNSLADIRVASDLDVKSKIFVYTDRPIYKPGDTVFINGVVRVDGDGLYKTPQSGKQIYINIPSYARDTEDINLTATLDEFGTFYTHYVLPKEQESDYVTIRAATEPFSNYNYGDGSSSFEVIKYVKPTFEIKSSVSKAEYLKPDTLTFTISGNYFNGKPLSNRDIEYTLYTDPYFEIEKSVFNKNFNITSAGGMCGGGGFDDYFGTEYKSGKVTLDNNGRATLQVSADDKPQMSQKITFIAKITDENKNEIITASNTIVHASEYNIFFMPSSDNYYPEDEVVAPFYTEYLSGEKVRNTTFEYRLIDYPDSYGSEKKPEKVIASGSVKTDENGKGIVTFKLPKSSSLSDKTKQLIITSKDKRNNIAQNQKTLSILKKDSSYSQSEPVWWGDSISQTYLKISSNQNSFKVGDSVSLTINSPSEFDAFVTLERGRIYEPKITHIKKGTNIFTFNVGDHLSPSITVVFSFFVDGKYYTEGLSLNVPAMHKLMNVDLKLDKTSYSPSDTAELLITTKNAAGSPVQADLSVGVVDKAIYALRESATSPIHSSFYYFRSRETNASSSLTGLSDWGGGGGGGGGGAGNPGSTVDVLYWNPDVRTDSSGEVRLPIPLLGHKTIWKVQVLGTTLNSDVGQADTEFIVGSEVLGVSRKKTKK